MSEHTPDVAKAAELLADMARAKPSGWKIVLHLLSTALIGSGLGAAIVGVVRFSSASGPSAVALAVVCILNLGVFLWRIEDAL